VKGASARALGVADGFEKRQLLPGVMSKLHYSEVSWYFDIIIGERVP